MNLDLQVFKRSTVKKAFYYFIAFNIVVCILSILLVAVTGDNIPGKAFVTKHKWLFMAFTLAFSITYNNQNKKELKAFINTPDFSELVLKYESYYRKKLIWSGFSLVITAVLFVMTIKNLFFYILIIQLILSFAFFPSKKLITKELNNREIIFE